MKRSRLRRTLLGGTIALALTVVALPWIVPAYWRARSDNPIRRGTALARELGCFTCHGDLGTSGIPDPGRVEAVPQWDGSVWMMYVKTDEDIRRYIAEGSPDPTDDIHATDTDGGVITMPAYGDRVSEKDLDDLVAAFKVLSGMVAPKRGTPARAGYELARKWKCFSCHGPGGAGGLSNPRSFTGFIPGWFGADFDDLVQSREEFDQWVREGAVPRLDEHPIARHFLNRQSIVMPPYREFDQGQLDNLWAYVQWLEETDGGYRGEILQW